MDRVKLFFLAHIKKNPGNAFLLMATPDIKGAAAVR